MVEEIDYIVNGTGDNTAEPVLFLHGIGGGAMSFNAQLSMLENYQCIAWNMPGYGASTYQAWPPTFESLSNALNNFIIKLGYQRVHLVGQSIGGHVGNRTRFTPL